MTDFERATEITKRLEQQYPLAETTLDYQNAWQLLVAVRLAAQCTDERVNIVTKSLFAVYPTLSALAAAKEADIAEMVRSCGLFRTKARDIHLATNLLLTNYNGLVPDSMEELLKLPGVGRKSANLILGDVFGKPAVVVDTHCIRLTNRFGLTDTKDPLKIEFRLRDLLDPKKSNDFCHRLVLHGRAVCTARSPSCERCTLVDVCQYGTDQQKSPEHA